MTAKHEWKWVDQEERFHFGDPSKPYAVDVWRCCGCGKEVATKGHKNPAPGRCS